MIPRPRPESADAWLDLALRELPELLRQGEPCACERLLERFPQIRSTKDALLELIYTEHVLQEERGVALSPDSWAVRFPELGQDLQQLFQVHGHVSKHSGTLQQKSSSKEPDAWGDGDHAQDAGRRIGKYELLELIGRGGGGEVYRARHVALGRVVALKLARHDHSSASDSQQRFRIEAEAAAGLHHPNIVPIHEVGIHQGRPYLTMEFVSGGNLSAAIKRHPLPARTAARIAIGVARAIHYAHENGVIHRDLKPANILLSPSDRPDAIELVDNPDSAGCTRFDPRIIDFGLAKRLDSASQETLPGAMLGTPGYMAPEQIHSDGQPAGPATDVYALGAVLYEMLAGRPPFYAATVIETLHQIKSDDPVPVRSLQPDIPRDLETIVLKCLRKAPSQRYESAAALADDLARFVGDKPIRARPTPSWERGVKWARRHPALAAMLATMVFGSAGVGWQWIRAERNRQEADQRTSDADRAREELRVERDQLQHALYAKRISLAQSEFENNHTTSADQLLHSTRSELRSWEFDFLLNQSRSVLLEFNEFNLPLAGIVISPDGKRLAATSSFWGANRQGETRVWNLETGQPEHVLRGHSSSVMDAAFSPDGRYLATAGTIWRAASGEEDKVLLWDLTTGELVREVCALSSGKIEFSRDGSTLIVADFHFAIRLFRVSDGVQLRTLQGHRGIVFDMALDESGRNLFTVARDGACRTWNLETGESTDIATDLVDARSVAISPNGQDLAVSTFTGAVKLFRRLNDRFEPLAAYETPSRAHRLRYSPDGLYLAVAMVDDGVMLLNPLTGKPLRRLPGHNGAANNVAFGADGRLLATAGSDGRVRVWDLARQSNPVLTLRRGPFVVDGVAIPGESNVVFALGMNTSRGVNYTDKSAHVWDPIARRTLRSFTGHEGWLTCVAYDSEHRRIATGSEDQSIRVWNYDTGAEEQRIDGQQGTVYDVAFAEHGSQLISCGADATVRVFDVATGMEQKAWSFPDEQPFGCAYLPQRNLVAIVGRSGRIHLRSPQADVDLASMQWEGPIRCLRASPDERRLAVSRFDHSIEIIDVDTLLAGNPIVTTLRGHTDVASSMDFSHDGSRLASASQDGVKIWSLDSGQELLRFKQGYAQEDSITLFEHSGDSLIVAAGINIGVWRSRPTLHGAADGATGPEADLEAWHRSELGVAAQHRNWPAMNHHLTWLASRRPADVDILRARGEARAEMGEWRDAQADFAVLNRQQATPGSLYQEAILSRAQNDGAHFRELLQRLLEIAEKSKKIDDLNSAAWTWALDRSPDRNSLEFPLPLDALANSKNSFHLNTLAAVWYRQGKFEPSIELIHRSLGAQRSEPTPHDWLLLALNHTAMGQPELAAPFRRQFDEWRRRSLPANLHLSVAKPVTWGERLELEALRSELSEIEKSAVSSVPQD